MNLCFVHSVLFFCWIVPVFSQDSSVVSLSSSFPDSIFIVRNIVLQGNSHTKDFVILREMTLKPGSPITQGALEYDKSRIYSLGLFNRVQLWVQPSGEPKADII